MIHHTDKAFALGRILRALALCALSAAACASSALADSKYTYTGNTFDSFGNGYSCPTTCSLSGSFTIATAIGPDNVVDFITPESWNFTDGTLNFNTSNSTFFDVGFATNSAGNIDEWIFEIDSNSGMTFLVSEFVGPGTAVDESGNGATGGFAISENQGTWNVSTAPEPSELSLLCVGLMGVISLIGLRQSTLGRSNSN
jgi:hypothetical protein